MDPGSDPGRDDYGLPRVEIEIPDDARDLDRDVQAYHREVRAQRRRNRVRRLAGPLIRHGVLIPLVAGCLALSLLAGTLLTILGGRQIQQSPARAPSGTTQRPASPAARAPAPAPARQLPGGRVLVNGNQIQLRQMGPALLAWVPATCGCLLTLKQLAHQAAAADVPIYLVASGGAVAQLSTLAGQAGQRSSQVVNDSQNLLAATYNLSVLTAILVRSDGSVRDGDVLRDPPPGIKIEGRLLALAVPAAGATASPSIPTHAPTTQTSVAQTQTPGG